ncbi:Alpha/Beta hydrolase protein [Blyttiomyces helicus]|uniref:Alpha/Beta hydrolase protein n=1 Tax=Blyttiomyces helicus TaxID=388810 RepID=A0A4V1IS21_9FUNG|nr:Alpha/Beta hydrolase protein [Blyttiomyces helicus]|eukprot:RKO92037.1 Alpha/Beta hydrolase protein [Blyttiomyces helicus]
MNPQDPNSWNHCFATVNSVRYHYVDEGSGEPIFLVHGFPDLWWGWRHVIPALVAKGYRVIVPDIRGYGQTDAPHASDEATLRQYGFKNIAKDLAELLEHTCGAGSQAIFIGHDWGGEIVWRMVLHQPQRVKAVGAVCTAFTSPNPEYIPPAKLLKALPQFKYQFWLANPAQDATLDANVELFLRNIFRPGNEPLNLLMNASLEGSEMINYRCSYLHSRLPRSSKQEFKYYVDEYKRRTFHGALNYYRTRKVNFDDERDVARTVDHQALMATQVIATQDYTLPPSMAKKMARRVPNAVFKYVEAGHWVAMEKADELNVIIGDWLDSLKSRSGSAKL